MRILRRPGRLQRGAVTASSGGNWVPPQKASLKLDLIAASANYTLGGGGGVATWIDRSGFSNDFTQGTQANQPTPEAAGLDGKASVLFVKASTHFLIRDGAFAALFGDGITQDIPFTLAMYGQIITATNNGALFGLGRSTLANPNVQLFNPSPASSNHRAIRRDDAGGIIDISTTETASTTSRVLIWTFAGTTITLEVDGAATSLNGSAMNTGVITFDRSTIGAGRLNLGAINPGDYRVRRFMIWPGIALSAAERANVVSHIQRT